ncbi:MAG: hypothetical protein P4L41_03175 [Flavipsychrobacter sp.]|nr:hypothetical protein [Flavipsychrobacter sp.]
MKKLFSIYLLSAFLLIGLASCTYQNYTPLEAQLAPLTNDSYTANTGWNADHYNTVSATRVPWQHVPAQQPTYQIIVTAK